LLGWWNLYRTLNQGTNTRIAILELADEQTALINIFEPMVLLYLAVLCVICAKFEHTPNKTQWMVLSVSFLVLAGLEIGGSQSLPILGLAADSHSRYIEFSSSLADTNDIRLLLLPLFLFPFAAGLYFTPFLRWLPPRHSRRFLACGAVYVAGVLGMEIVSQSVAMEYGSQSMLYLVTAGVEESLELLSLVGFCLAVGCYMREQLPELKLIVH
jgi:hypothetical protein